MISEENKSFAQQLIAMYEDAGLPAVALDSDFSVLWCNDTARGVLPGIALPDGARRIFEPYGVEAIKAEISAHGCFSSEAGTLFDGGALTVCALREESGYLVMPAPPAKQSAIPPKGVLRTIGAFDAQYRTRLNLLFSALGNAGRALAPEACPEEREHAHDYLEVAGRNALLLLRTCDWVSSYARLVGDPEALHPVKLELYGWLRGFLADAAELCAERGVPLHIELPQGMRLAMCDVERLAEVLANLLSNSCRFTREGNSILVRGYCVDDQLCIAVVDCGAGIPAEVMPYVFEPYYSYSRDGHPFSGNGLGLALVQGIAALMGGTVQITSTDGAGTTVLFAVPLLNAGADFPMVESEIPDYAADRFSVLRVAMADSTPIFGTEQQNF